jgi:hypothetical protein
MRRNAECDTLVCCPANYLKNVLVVILSDRRERRIYVFDAKP